ncbi:MAG TPA: hypothetical protein DEO60_12360, partial [Bacteroidales bacterium]|nr:hypothetical protein [Bacteroidales bacterium]
MNRYIPIVIILFVLSGCSNSNRQLKRTPVAKAGLKVLYYDEIPEQTRKAATLSDSAALIQNYINKWAKRELMFQKAEENLSSELVNAIDEQIQETRQDLVVYEYQSMMIRQKMDTVIINDELEKYYTENKNSFNLTSNIVKALFIKLPVETPNIWKI